ncbi:MAG TPA: hypothetical protein VHC21_03575 [Candidatus Saccharimonadales bacterium]|nr:hypothetical protein [Candidatus Saccharimonadales bacterium]
MDGLVTHPQTQAQLAAYVATPAQTVLLTGPGGSGKFALAQRLAEQVLDLAPGKFAAYGYGMIIRPEDGKAISIETARQLERFLSLKVPVARAINRAVIIGDSHLLTAEAQNALLKTLEEPPAGTLLILTASHGQALLPTIHSRLQAIAVRRPAQAALSTHFQRAGFAEDQIRQAYAMSGGLPGLMQALLSDEEHPLKLAATQARQLLSQPLFERLITIDVLAKQRQLAIDSVEILQQMAHISLQNAVGKAAQRWQKVLAASYQTAEALEASGQLKLALTNLALSF